MAQLSHVTTQHAGSGPLAGPQMVALSALLVWEADAPGSFGRLYSASGAGGGVLGWSAGLTPLGGGSYAASAGLDAPRGLLRAEIGGESLLLAPGRHGAGIEAWRTDAGGALTGPVLLRYDDGAARALLALAVLRIGAAELLVTAARQGQGGGLEIWRAGPGGLEALAQEVPAGLGGEVSALAVSGTGAQTRILALSPGENSLYSWSISAVGQLGAAQRLGPPDGLYLDRPTRLETVSLAGQDYALIGAASGMIAVVALDADGGMRVTDLVGDDLATRFAGVTALAVLERGGQVFVVAAGSDDGLSLMTLLPGGRLLHLGALADDTRMALSDPAALALAEAADGLVIYAAGGWPEGADGEGDGISRIRAQLGPVGEVLQLGSGADSPLGTAGNDQIHGGAGDDVLRGGAGDDILIDGPGQDRLTGGAGADVFVFTADGQTDRITDFEPGVDRIDLSDIGRFYTLEALEIRSTARGARITLGGESLQVDSAAGTPLDAADFTIGDLRDLWHIDSEAIPDTPLWLRGSAGPDLLQGRGAADTLEGGAGADLLRGGGGDDLLRGEAADPDFDPVSGQVYRIYRATLDRAPDLAGLLNWSARLIGGARDLEQVVAGFTGSAEFRASYGALDDAGFVTQLYRNVLGRAPDAQGLENWAARLAGGMSRERVVLGFSESAEFRAATAAGAAGFARGALQQDWSDDVFRLYQAVLDRAPDLAGLLAWSGRLAEGRDYLEVVTGFTASAEFRASYGALGDAGFVAQLYRNVLGREGEAAGLAAWTGRLEAGMSRAEVVRGFAQSAEFRAATAPALLEWMRGTGMDDRLEGGSGRNLLVGGVLADVFVFRAGEAGQHDVADLERWDQLRFEGFGYSDSADLRARFAPVEEGLLFSDQGVRVLLHGGHLAELHDDMLLL